MTNGERMRRGLPPKKPHFRRAAGTPPRPLLSRNGNEFGEYGYTTTRDDALTVTINNCTGSPFGIVSSNGYQAYSYIGGISGYANDSPDLRDGSSNYVYIGGVTETDPLATPQNIDNSFTAATEIQEAAESAIWSFRNGGDGLRAQWVNSDGSTPTNRLVYVPDEGVFVLVGDVAAFENAFGPVSEAVSSCCSLQLCSMRQY
ncbi:uncharacterized protein PHACADRAFT_103818 [Phanerochaete carnosa HHB-10118-sp]|uniref:Uncharacterized protein n=1 Tax=Phanerochaete carnosa (strain HHB-10118-sp) TaxID=650164 RepID=K5VI00_PHACS|nr:uncharacterized protein PHACADRAFT_103818 [Phanerochaete carnosa HHB-10118-sp]EKM50878.1 hypothetical protein PHACADRAFT_103818 [Phanerochaete carnosa HHB-10118-sp]